MCWSLASSSLVVAVVFLGPSAANRPAPDSVDELLAVVEAEYGTKEKKYASLAKDVGKAVEEALRAGAWEGAAGERPLEEHPLVVWTRSLAELARAENGERPSILASELLVRYPWSERVELSIGLDGGSDRPVPAHSAGFIHLGKPAGVLGGFPDLYVNQYLYGLQEIVGWQYAVSNKRRLSFVGREEDHPPVVVEELPPWESLRVQLEGSLPDTALLALPRLTHTIHAHLVERRRGDPAEVAPMDEALGFLDSKWNGFTFQPPWAKDPLPFVQLAHALYTDSKGFVFRFPRSPAMAMAGDIPFMSNSALQQYGKHFMDIEASLGAFVRRTPDAVAIEASFGEASTYLARYKMLIEVVVRAALTPNVRYPSFLEVYDFPDGEGPRSRARDAAFDIPRKHAVLLWAYCGKDPAAVADWLHDHVLAVEENRYPTNVSLPVQLTLRVREHEREMVEAIAARAAGERGPDGTPGDFEREFSPHATYLDPSTGTAGDYVLESFTRFNEPVALAVRGTAERIVVEEVVD